MPFDFRREEENDNRSKGKFQSNSARGFQNTGSTTSKGFSNVPTRKSNSGNFHTPSPRMGDTYSGRMGKTRERRSVSRSDFTIPWNIILIISGIVIIIAALWIYKDVISAFLSQVLSWVITILLIIFLVRVFIFRR